MIDRFNVKFTINTTKNLLGLWVSNYSIKNPVISTLGSNIGFVTWII